MSGPALVAPAELVRHLPAQKDQTTLRPDAAMREQLNPDLEIDRDLAGQSQIPRSFTVHRASAGPLPDHCLALWDDEEQLLPPGHPGAGYVARTYGAGAAEVVHHLKGDPTALFGIPILEVEDAAGLQLRHVMIEPRVFHRDCPEKVPARTMVIIPELAVLHYPRCLRPGLPPALAMRHALPARGCVERRAYLQAREKLETAEALAAFGVLFRHYSFNEELFRLDALMRNLPWTLEEHPGMQRYRDLLETQIGHLRGGAGHWYATQSPAAGVEVDLYVRGIAANPKLMPVRLQWLVDECRARGYRRVAEYGSVEGVSLFHLVQQAADIEWHGFEANLATVARGRELAAQAGLGEKFHLHPMSEPCEPFDAIALFEVLEHNSEEEGAELLRAATARVRPGGTVFVTTPWGNWSAFDDHTRDLRLRKDHVLAFTVARMERFLAKYARAEPGSIRVERVQNPALHEWNSWCFAHFTVREVARP